MSEATTGVPAANASVRTMPKLSPPSDGAAITSAARSAADFWASETRPSAVALHQQRGDFRLRGADDGQPRGHVLAHRLEGADQHGQPLALDGLADERD